jgi:UMF1 family MFS transporter
MKLFKNKKIFSWAMYDWANSTYSTTVMAGFFPVFFKEFWSAGTDPVVTTARLGAAISISSLLMALLSPTLGVVADLKGYKKHLCLFFMFVGVLSCGWMAFIPSGDWWHAILAYGIAMMAYNASCVFYDALLPFVAEENELDYASAVGYSLGYLGGGLLFLINVFMYLKPAMFGLKDGVQAVQISFLSVAAWWFLFSIPLAKNVPEPDTLISEHGLWTLTTQSVKTLKTTFQKLMKERNLLMFVLAYWFYIDGVYTVMTMAVDFGISIGFKSKELIAALLITQFIGFPCAYYFGAIAKKWGSRGPIMICLACYGLTVVLATQMTEVWHFFTLAAFIGMAQGGVQSLSRSLFARMTPKEYSGEYFALFNVVGRFASIFGPLVVTLGVMITGNSRMGMASLLILFIIGGGFLSKVKEPGHLS